MDINSMDIKLLMMIGSMILMYFKLSSSFKKAIKDEIQPVVEIQTLIVQNIQKEINSLETRTNTVEKILYHPDDGIIVKIASLKQQSKYWGKHRD